MQPQVCLVCSCLYLAHIDLTRCFSLCGAFVLQHRGVARVCSGIGFPGRREAGVHTCPTALLLTDQYAERREEKRNRREEKRRKEKRSSWGKKKHLTPGWKSPAVCNLGPLQDEPKYITPAVCLIKVKYQQNLACWSMNTDIITRHRETVVSFSKCHFHTVPPPKNILTWLSTARLHPNYVNDTEKKPPFFFFPLFVPQNLLSLTLGLISIKIAVIMFQRHCANRVICNLSDLDMICFIHDASPVPLTLLLHCIPQKTKTSFFFFFLKLRGVKHKIRRQEACS